MQMLQPDRKRLRINHKVYLATLEQLLLLRMPQAVYLAVKRQMKMPERLKTLIQENDEIFHRV
jgi:hypothetical protein